MKMHRFIRQQPAALLVAVVGALIAAVNLASAQPLQPEGLFSFDANSTDGAYPQAALTLGSDGNLYGTTAGSSYDYVNYVAVFGTVFRMTTNGVLTTLAYCDGFDGAFPEAPLTQANDGNLYGTTSSSGTFYWGFGGAGTVFRVTTNGVLTYLVSLAYTNGWNPGAGLALGSDGNFYGTTWRGGDLSQNHGYGDGVAFRVMTNGVLTTFVSFNGTNGWQPFAGLTLGSDGNFYGTTGLGGDLSLNTGEGDGTVFRVTTNGVLTTLVSFNGTNGAFPSAGLTQDSNGNFYGTTAGGGAYGYVGSYNGFGTIFQLTTNGVLTTLVSFNGTNGALPYNGGLTLGSDGNFYGVTIAGGSGFYGTNAWGEITGNGTVFQVTTDGMLTTLASSVLPSGMNGLTLGGDGNFYGTTTYGGDGFAGTIYRLRRGVSIQAFGMKTNGFQLNTLNVGGSGWVVLESSRDLMNWTPIQTNGTVAAQQFLDPAGLTQPRQFYRVRQQ